MKKVSSILFALFLSSLLLLQGCNSGVSEVTTGLQEQSGEEITTQAPEARMIDFIADGKSNYKVVRADECVEVIITDALTLKKRIKSAIGADLDYTTDWVKPGTDTAQLKEILVGETSREESASFIGSLPENGYGYAVINEKLVIAGKNPHLTSYALTLFENRVIYNKEYAGKGYMKLPADFSDVLTSEKGASHDGIISSSDAVGAYTEDVTQVKAYNGFNAAQGAATDGTYYYGVLKKKVGDLETDVICKVNMETNKVEKYSKELPLDHANDMCYNSDEKMLVIPNMIGKKISFVDPETLEIVKTVDATALGGTPWAIAYHASDKSYVIAAGGYLNICDADFNVKRRIDFHSESTYTGQGMDCDENYIYMPYSPNSTYKTTDNIIIVYDYNKGFTRVIHLNIGIESETMFNYNGTYWISFNSGGWKICKLMYARLYQ